MNTVRIGGLAPETLVERFGSPLYAYDASVIKARCRSLRRAFPGFNFYYACKANTNPAIVRLIARERFSVEAVSPREIALARAAGVPARRIAFTAGSISEKELLGVVRQGVHVHLDSLTQVEWFGKRFPGRDISVRLNQGIGSGHHEHVITGGSASKFGIAISHIPQLKKLAATYHLRIVGLHQHIGSNVLDARVYLRAVDVLLLTAEQFPDLERLDFGGGFGVAYKPGEKPLDISALGAAMRQRAHEFSTRYGKKLAMSFEPGRYLVAEAGTLLATVTDIKRNPKKTFIGIDSGMGHLIRPSLYGSYHEMRNVSRPRASKQSVTVVGPYCESGDFFAKDRSLPMPHIGDVLAVANSGAYGYVMTSDYNMRGKPAEVLVEKGKARLIRRREN